MKAEALPAFTFSDFFWLPIAIVGGISESGPHAQFRGEIF
jgi:hypothetical protein